jgi:serine/threonine protein kinase
MSKTKKKYRNKGGKVIASGGYGCVFNPALKCQGATKRGTKKISKLMIERHATEEYQQINNINDKLNSIPNYEDYFLVYDTTLCRPGKLSSDDLGSFDEKCSALPKNNITKENINSRLNEVLSLELPNGGLPVDDYVYSNGGYDKLYKIHMALIKLLKKGIIPMNKKHIYHSDIKDSNVLIDNDDATIKARLIDWGLTVEYNPDTKETFPKNWRNRPLQFNVPFSVIIFTDLFYEKYSYYLKNGGRVEEASLKPFIIDYFYEWTKERGAGHYKFINEIMYMLYNVEIKSITETSKPNLIETEITMPFIVNSLVDVLLHYTKFKEDGSLNLREYLNKVYIKNVDIWGFITVYYPFLEMFSNNYRSLNEDELKIFKQIKFIFNKYLYMPSHEPINTEHLLNDLKILGKLIYIVAHNKKKYQPNSLAKGIKKTKTRKIKSSPIFNRKKLVKKFKNPFLLSLTSLQSS